MALQLQICDQYTRHRKSKSNIDNAWIQQWSHCVVKTGDWEDCRKRPLRGDLPGLTKSQAPRDLHPLN